MSGGNALLISTRSLEHYAVHAMDGDIGRVYDVWFDDEQWTVRHAVVSTGHWLRRRRVLLPLASLRQFNDTRRELDVTLTKAQVEASPDIRTDQPVSRQHEASLFRYYGFPYYWHGPAINESMNWEGTGDPHLRSAREVTGYFVHELDDTLGRVADLLIDEDGWVIRYVVVDLPHRGAGQQVVVPRTLIAGIRWAGAEILVDLKRETLEQAPGLDAARPVDRAYEQRLHDYYGRPPYWTGGTVR